MLSGTNTYDSGTTISAGTLQIGAGGASGSVTGAITNQSALVFNRSDSVTYNDVISGSGTLTKLGTGTLTLSGAHTYTGTTTIGGGTLAVTGSLADTNQVSIGAGATYNVNVSDTVGSIEGAGNISTGAASGTVTLTADLDSSLSKTFSGVMSNGGTATLALNKSGAGTLTLSGVSSYSGATTVSGGVLKLGASGSGSNSPLGNTTGNTSVSSGAALDLGGFTLATAEPLTIQGTGIAGGGALLNSGSAATYSGPVTLSGSSSIVGGSGTIALSHSGALAGGTSVLTLGGAQGGSVASILSTSTRSLVKEGSGTWTLSGANTYTGGTLLSGGKLSLAHASTSATSTPNALGPSGTISFAGGALQFTASNTVDYSSRFSNAAGQAYAFDTNGQNVTLATVPAGSGAFIKTGTGNLTITDSTTRYGAGTVGATTISAGTLT